MNDHPIFNDEHRAIRKTLHEFVTKELTPHADEWEEKGEFPSSVFHRMGELGFLGLHYPEEYGGQGGDYLCGVILAEEMMHSLSGGLAMAIGVQTDMVCALLHKVGSESIKERFLRPALKGEKIGCLCITEPDAGSDVAGIRTSFVRDGNDYILSGQKTFITNGVRADFAIVVARSRGSEGPKGISILVVEKGTAGFSVSRKLEKVGMHSSDTAELAFQDCRVPEDNLLGEEDQGFYQIMWELQPERLFAAISSVAGAQRVLDTTLKYVRERQQFGRPIGKFQAIRHRLAEMATNIEAARQLSYHVAGLINAGEFPAKEISMAKLFATRVAYQVADEAMQFHGGYGYMMEFPIQRFWRDSRLARIGGGTDEIMLEIISRQMI
ncbi:MAG: acyl-CoA dehydrogenase family protein [Clostridia bacterium]|nr:acyl-CoA dehydrogenase family protein [Clostridia bacterium]